MITFEEAKTLHEALAYDSCYSPRVVLHTPISKLSATLEQAFKLLDKVEIIVIPWEHAQSFGRQWEHNRDIRSAREINTWLWGYFCTYKDVDCFASRLASCIVVSGVRDLRNAYEPEDRVVLISITEEESAAS